MEKSKRFSVRKTLREERMLSELKSHDSPYKAEEEPIISID